MPLFNKKKSQLDSRESKLVPVSSDNPVDEQSEEEIKFKKDYEEGLDLFMKNEGYDTPESALLAVSEELDKIIKPKILPKTTKIEPIEESSNKE